MEGTAAPAAPARPSTELTMRQGRQYLAEVTECRMTQGVAPARLLWERLGFMAFPAELLDPLEPKPPPRLPADLPAEDWRDLLAHLMIHPLEGPAGDNGLSPAILQRLKGIADTA